MDTLSLSVQIKNKSKTATLKFLWDEAFFIYPNGENSKVVHSEDGNFTKAKAKLPTTIFKKQSKTENIFPAVNISWTSDSTFYWKEKSFFKDAWGTEQPNAEKEAQNYLNKKLKISVPVMVDKNKTKYIFTFTISDTQVRTRKTVDVQSTYAAATMVSGFALFLLMILVFR